ncbi:VanZ family protein [Agarivorans sp. MS3-6]|uniref:VanZ family protein n=1 Tax=Agarivorans sp. TSD2052 TaxID=2937286 RepID=UPI00200BE057|nr:VanZ family protein [Agarivorans sp. TSD2052]UPW19627.1 VanZ family protein [Agarivorans sp. TSD2052]
MSKGGLIFRWLFYASLLVVLVLALWPLSIQGPVVHTDKGLHFLCFFMLAWLSQLAAFSRWHSFGLLLVFGISIELAQGLSSYRQASWLDLLADVLGTICYLALSFNSTFQKVNRCITAQ